MAEELQVEVEAIAALLVPPVVDHRHDLAIVLRRVVPMVVVVDPTAGEDLTRIQGVPLSLRRSRRQKGEAPLVAEQRENVRNVNVAAGEMAHLRVVLAANGSVVAGEAIGTSGRATTTEADSALNFQPSAPTAAAHRGESA